MSYAFINMADPHQVVQFHKVKLLDKLPKELGLINIVSCSRIKDRFVLTIRNHKLFCIIIG